MTTADFRPSDAHASLSLRRPHRSGRLSRRAFLGGAAGAAAFGLVGCGSGDGPRAVTGLDSRQLRVWNWSEYIDVDDADVSPTLEAIRTQFDIDVAYDASYEDNAAAWQDVFRPAINSGGTIGYDIVMPTNWLAARLIERDWVEPLPLELIPNHVNIDPSFLTPSWDRGARFNMPWQAGITGIAYDPARTGGPITSLSALFDGSLDGGVGAIPEMREAVGLAMLLDGTDPTRPDADSTAAALARLQAATESGQMTFTYDFVDGLTDGSLVAAMAWSGDIVQLQADRPDIEFVIPDEGAIQWFDTMIIAGGSPNVAPAARFMNHVYDPANAANITEWVQYITPVLGVREELRSRGGDAAALAENAILFPDDETRSRLFTWGSLEPDVEAPLETAFADLSG